LPKSNHFPKGSSIISIRFSIQFVLLLLIRILYKSQSGPVLQASNHFDSSDAEVDFWIVLVQLGEPEYHALLAESSYSKQNVFKVLIVGHDYINNFQDWLRQFAGQFGLVFGSPV